MDADYCRYCKRRSVSEHDGVFLCKSKKYGKYGGYYPCSDVSPLDCKRVDIPVELREESLPKEYFDFVKIMEERVEKGITAVAYMKSIKSYLQKIIIVLGHEGVLACDPYQASVSLSGTELRRSGRYRKYYRAIVKYQDYYLKGTLP